MEEKLATIQRIKSLEPISGADRIELAKMEGLAFQSVVRKGEFKAGDLVAYIVIDSIVDKDNPYFKFMEERKYRVWNCKFKKTPSQGLVVPLTALSHYDTYTTTLEVGDDVTKLLKVIKYERPFDPKIAGEAKGHLPSFLEMSDELNLLSYPDAFNEFKGKEVYISIKYDGSSNKWYLKDGEFGVCSRRLDLKDGDNVFWNLARKYHIEYKLRRYNKNIALCGEVYGPKIQSNPLQEKENKVIIYDIWNIETRQYYNYQELLVAINADLMLAECMPKILYLGDFKFNSIDELQELANSVKYKDKPGEGIVIRPTIGCYSPALGKRLSVKVVNQNY